MQQEQQPMMAADGGSVPDSSVAGYTTPAGYNEFDYPSGGRIELKLKKVELWKQKPSRRSNAFIRYGWRRKKITEKLVVL